VSRPNSAPSGEENTARFVFQGAIGVGLFCTGASLWLGLQENSMGGAVFLLLGFISLGVVARYGTLYRRIRNVRWQQELERSNAAMEQLFTHARAEAEHKEEDGDRA
jgi:hypothetical protein